MEKVFGIPADGLLVGLLIVTGLALGAVAVLAMRNRVLVRLGLRNATRRRGRTALIVLGLMLGTAIISAALTTGDTMSHTIRTSAVASLGETDVVVSPRSAEADSDVALGSATSDEYFSTAMVGAVDRSLAGTDLADGVTPAIVEPVAMRNSLSGQSEPRVTLFAADPARLDGFGPITERDRGAVELADLRPGQVFLNADAADELDAATGDRVRAFATPRGTPLTVAGIVSFDGTGTDGPAMMMPLPAAQQLIGRPGRIRQILISGRGETLDGVELTQSIADRVNPAITAAGLTAHHTKADALDAADEEGNGFMTLFTTFGSFSIAAGILLIFLIFVMLAAERRSELGVARALGMRRGHLVQMFMLEGVVYDLVAAFVGALLGVAVSFAMVLVLASAFASFGFDIERDVKLSSLAIAYCLGVVLTLGVVVASAARVSRLNVVTAIRDLPEPPSASRRRRSLLLGVVGVLLGLMIAASGASSDDGPGFLLGVSIVFIGLVPLGRVAGVPERVTKTGAGIALVVWWLLPATVLEAVFPDLKFDMSAFILSGLMVVLGAAWTVMYNADVLLSALMWLGGRIRSLTPVLKMAISYPLRNLFRTGVTFTMFTLVVFTLVTGGTISGAFVNAFDDRESFSGGFDVRADTAPANPILDMDSELAKRPELSDRIEVAASQSFLPVKAAQVGAGRAPEDYPIRGLDDEFLDTTTFGLAAMARGYDSAEDVWNAVQWRSNLAVIDAVVAPRRDNYNTGAILPDFELSGFFLEDERFDPIPVTVRDPQTGKQTQLTIIGILKETAPLAMSGISTSQRSIDPVFGDRVQPTAHYFKLAPGADPEDTADRLETSFLANGMKSDSLDELLDDITGASRTFNLIVQGFMGLGLVIGVAALGVISARSVVERRQQIGVLRAIGFRRGMIQLSLLIESSFLALTAIIVGTGLGLVLSFNIISDTARQSSWDNLAFDVPWVNLLVIFAGVYVASLLATLAPARRASRVYPSEALRYQ